MDVDSLQRVLVVGTGLIGTSIALSLRAKNVRVSLADRDMESVWLARNLGAGEEWDAGEPADVAVIAVPPGAVGPALSELQKAEAARFYTDVASVKALPLREAERLRCDLTTYVPGHPLAGRERSGPAAARADLFLGRPWALCPTPQTSADALQRVRLLVVLCGGKLVELDAQAHDHAVALMSHAPHVAAAAMAARLSQASEVALGLAGQGLRDVTRIAGGDPGLWTGILAGNAGPVADVLDGLAADLSGAAAGLRVEADISDLLERGVAGQARIPGKHGGPARSDAVIQVVLDDRPGELARLFQAVGDAGVNIEDVRLEHSPGLPVGVAELFVRPEDAAGLTDALRAHGWRVPK